MTIALPKWALSCAVIRCYYEFAREADAYKIKAVLEAAGLDVRVWNIASTGGTR